MENMGFNDSVEERTTDETEFAIDGAGKTRIEFLPAQNGEIVRLRLSRDGRQVTAERQ